MDIGNLVVDIFQHYFKQAYDPDYFTTKESNEKLIDNFLNSINKQGIHKVSIGEDFLNTFFRFQFEYWLEKDLNNKPKISWFIGKKAVDRYFSVKDRELSSYWVNKKTQNYSSLIENIKEYDYEINFKKKYHNSENGLIFCLEHTSLYSKCLPCLSCNFKEDCKKLLRENYPMLFKKRLKK